MALDSMKIFDTVEQHFKIALTEDEVDESNTVGEIADAVCRHITFNGTGKSKHEMMFDLLHDYIPTEFGHPAEEFSLSTVLRDFMPVARSQMYWDKLAADFDIELPMLKPADVNPRISADSLLQGESLRDNTINDLINWILALNYEKLVAVNKLVNRQEVECVVTGIVNEITGIGVEDIEPHYDMAKDLGIR